MLKNANTDMNCNDQQAASTMKGYYVSLIVSSVGNEVSKCLQQSDNITGLTAART